MWSWHKCYVAFISHEHKNTYIYTTLRFIDLLAYVHTCIGICDFTHTDVWYVHTYLIHRLCMDMCMYVRILQTCLFLLLFINLFPCELLPAVVINPASPGMYMYMWCCCTLYHMSAPVNVHNIIHYMHVYVYNYVCRYTVYHICISVL